MSLEGETSVVTGFGGGLGSDIAVSLAQAGCAIVGTDISRTETVQANSVKVQEMWVSLAWKMRDFIYINIHYNCLYKMDIPCHSRHNILRNFHL